MPTIKIKGSSTAAAEPLTLAERELAVNVTDKKLYVGDGAAVQKIVGSLGNQEASAVAITGGSIAGITDLAVADGGTGASTAADARTNLGITATGADTTYAFRSNNLSDLASASTARTNLGLGSIATQASSSVSITGGSITGVTDIAIADGGTGASTAADARTNLGLGSIATQSASSVAITGGTISGITDLAVADGGTGASTAADARTNLSVPSTTGSGASGTWGIDISGNAATATSATSATTATNLAGGAANRVPYQSASGTTTFVAAPTVTNSYLKWNGTALGWDTVSGGGGGSGDVVGPASATDNAIVRFDGTTGKLVQNSVVTIADSTGDISGVGQLNATTVDATNVEVTNIKAKDGTAAATIADSTGVVTVTAAPVMTALTASQAVFTTAGKALTSNAITGTGNVVMSASPTLTGTISAAAATLSGNLTLSGGTANGVVYLNASKQATTGTALAFDGNALTLGGSAPRLLSNMSGALSTRFIVQNSTTNGNTRVYLYPNGTGTISAINGVNNSDVAATDYQAFDLAVIGTTDVRLSSSATGAATPLPLTFYTNGSEQMRLNSTGLGIGTSSFTARLTTKATTNNYTAGALALQGAVSGTTYITNAGGTFYISNDGSTDHLIMSSSGNLGLGVTPSAWRSGARALQLGQTGYASLNEQANGSTSLNFNCYESAANTWTYYVTGVAPTRYTQQVGVHSWFTAPSGTAGATTSITSGQVYTVTTLGSTTLGQWQAYFSGLSSIPSIGQSITATATGTLAGGATVTQTITFTQALTLTANRNFLVGTTSENSGNGGLKVAGQFALTTSQAFAASGSVNDTAYYIVCYSLSGTCTLTLPTPANNTGRLLNIVVQSAQKVVSASSNVTKITDGTPTTDILPATAGKWVQLWCDGGYWNIIATNV